MKKNIRIFPDSKTLNQFAAEIFIRNGTEAIQKQGRFTVALAGGSTPKSLYRLLAGEPFKSQIEWRNVFFFFGDERNVLPVSEESNYRMADENLFKPLEISTENIFRWKTELTNAELIADKYQDSIVKFFNLVNSKFPRFDLILLGMGDDGHTASLFPHTKALGENVRIAVANPVEKLATVRLTLTFPALNNAANVVFLVAGENKAESLQAIIEGDGQPEKYPAQNIHPENGSVFWLVDENAAKMLSIFYKSE
jgi:6-phosphogluconolactonase